jgi:hypothetical protein
MSSSSAGVRYQVHEHSVESQLSPAPKLIHAHAGGERPHKHPKCGPAFYGYGAPKFSAKPKGEQRTWVDLEEWQTSFEIHLFDPMPSKGEPGYIGEGPGLLPVERMVTGFKMRVSRIVDHTAPPPRKRSRRR